MTPPLFLAEAAELTGGPGTVITVSGPEGRHAAAVRRIRVGEIVDLADGWGVRSRCTVVDTTKDSIVCEVCVRTEEPVRGPHLTVVQALPKGDRGELAVEMMTEAGVDRVVPWAAERCITRWKGERAGKALTKWRVTAREAGKQSRRSRFPEVADPVGRAGVADLLAGADLGLILHEEGAHRLSEVDLPTEGSDVVLVVGPEGGFSDSELATFDEAGAVRALLGPSVLRTSTAGVAALAVLQARTGRW